MEVPCLQIFDKADMTALRQKHKTALDSGMVVGPSVANLESEDDH